MAKTTNTAPGEQADIDPDMTAAPGQVPDRVIEELRLACRTATDYGQAFGDACARRPKRQHDGGRTLAEAWR